MSSNTLSRPTQHCLQRLTADNEPTIFADAKFFARRLDRRHRVRLASSAEVETIRLLQPPTDLAFGLRWYTTVKQIRPGLRARVFSGGQPDLDCDLPEATCALLYIRVASARSPEFDNVWNDIVTLKGARS